MYEGRTYGYLSAINLLLLLQSLNLKQCFGSGAGSGSVSQRYGPEPNPYQNVKDPEH